METVQLELLCGEGDSQVDAVLHVASENGLVCSFRTPSKPAAAEASAAQPQDELTEEPSISTSSCPGDRTEPQATDAAAEASNETLASLHSILNRLASQLQNKVTCGGTEALPPSTQCMPRAALTSASVDKLLALELEVVQLQQSLQIAKLDFETRSVQTQSLSQRLHEAEARAQAAEERADRMAQQVQQAEAQCSRMAHDSSTTRSQLNDALAQSQQQLAECASRLEDMQAECSRLRKQADRVRPLELEVAQLRRAADLHSAQAGEWRERMTRARQENQQLRAQIGSACGALKTLGIPVQQVFTRSALALASGGSTPVSNSGSPARLPAGHAVQLETEAAAAATGLSQPPLAAAPAAVAAPRPRELPPRVPRLQLSAISLHQLQERASQQQEAAAQAEAMPEPAGEPIPAMQHHPSQQQQLTGSDPHAHVLLAADGSQALPPPQPAAEQQAAAAIGPVRPAPPALVIPPSSAYQSLTSEQWQTAKARLSLESPIWQSVQSGSLANQSTDPGADKWPPAAGLRVSPTATAGREQPSAIPAYHPAQHGYLRQQTAAQHAQQQWPMSARQAAVGPDTARSHAGSTSLHPQLQQQWAQRPLTSRTERGSRPASTSASGPAPSYIQRYGQVPEFQEVRQAYQAVVAAGAAGDRTSKWVSSVLSSASAVEANPRRVEPVMEALLQLFLEVGLDLPLCKTGPCQYQLGPSRMTVRLVNGRLMTRSGPTNVDVLDWLERQPIAKLQQAQLQMQAVRAR